MKKPTRKQREIWEDALTCALPPSSGYELLQALRLEVVKYLNWATHDLVLEDELKALREIRRAADRLIRITSMIPDAAARMMSGYKKQTQDREWS